MRESANSIVEKRKKKESKIFLTGGTGFVGSYLAAELLKRGYFIIFLSRSAGELSASERIAQILAWHNYSGKNFEVIDGQITGDHFGLNDEQYRYLVESTGEIWHCASDTSFSGKTRAQSEAVNVQGTLNVLKLAVESKCYFFHHMSSAYIAGKQHGICKEEFEIQAEFHNVYEETKYKAEEMVIEICRKEGIRANIYRPSIVYGDSRSGRSLQFKAFYVPIRAINFLKNTVERDFDEKNGVNAKRLGANRDGTRLWLPIRVRRAEGSSFNLVPIDFVVAQCIAIMENSLQGDIFHLVSRKPNTLEELIDLAERFFDIRGPKAVLDEEFTSQPKSALERLFYSFIEAYQPYFSDTRIFENKKGSLICPPLDFETFSKCIDYAIKVDWGNKLHKTG